MTNSVFLPFIQAENPSRDKPIGLGALYIGQVDKDPKTVANQIVVYAVNNNGSEIAISQPIDLSAGGVAIYNGSPVQLKVGSSVEEFSMRIDDFNGSQQYYTPRAQVPGSSAIGALNDFIADLASTTSDVSIAGVDARYIAKSVITTTVAQLASGAFQVGSEVSVSDRSNARFSVVSGGTANGYDILSAGSGKTAVCQYSYDVRVSWILNGADTLKDFLPILAARPIGGCLIIDTPITQNPFKIPSWVTVKGLYKQDGWARQADYKTPSKITLSASANDYLVTVDGSTVNWGLQDVVLDGNKDNQSSYGSGCIKTRAAAFRNFGGLIDGVKCVNAKGWGAYFTGGPLNISNSFFMSGAVFVGCSDLKISNVDFDGTDGLHCSLLMVKTATAEACSNIFAYGWGEVDQTKQLQEQSATVATSGAVTIAGDTWLYDEAPVSLSGTPSPVGLVKEETFFAKFISAGNWELYTLPPSNVNAVKVTFDVSGSVTLRHGNAEEVTCLSRCSLIEIGNFRSAGGKLQGIKYIATDRTKISAFLWNNNMRQVASVPAAEFIASSNNVLSGSLGEVSVKVNYAVAFKDSSGVLSTNNRIPDDTVLQNTTTGIWVLDQSSGTYKNRNRFNAIGLSDDGVKRYTSTNKDKEPGVQMAFIKATADQVIPSSTNTPLEIDLENATGITKPNATTAQIACTQQALYELSGNIGLTAKPANDVLYTILGIGSNPDTPSRFYSDAQSVTINCRFYSTTEALRNIQVQLFSSTSVTVSSSEAFTFLTLRKVSDAPYTA